MIKGFKSLFYYWRNNGWRIILLSIIVITFLVAQTFAQNNTNSQTETSSGSASTEQSENEKQEEEKKESEEESQEEEQKTEEDVATEEISEEQAVGEEEKKIEDASEPRDLLKIFEEMKKSGPGGLKELETPGEKPKVIEPEKPSKPMQQDFVGPPLPGEEKQKVEEFVGPKLPDIRLPPIEDETFKELEFEGIEPPEGRKYVDFSADKITRDKLKEVVKFEGNARLVYEDVTILSEFAEFNEKDEWGKFWGKDGVLADNEDGIMKCDTLDAYFKDKVAKAHGNIEIFVYSREYKEKLEEDSPRKERLKRALGQDDTTIYCDEGEYDWGEKIFHGWVEKSEKVRIIQEGRHAFAKAVYHERKTELTVLENDVELWHKKGDWLFDRDVATDKEDKWANALLRPETTITADVLESRGEEEIVILEGNVLAVQKDKRGSADKVIFNDKEQIMVAEGNVKAHQNNGDWLVLWKIVDPKEETEETMKDLEKVADGQADKFTLWTEKKDFEAEGNVKAWQDHQDITADKVTYKKEIDRLGVYGNVKFNRKDKDDLIGDTLFMWLTTKVYEAFGKVESNKKVDIEEERRKARDEKEKEKSEPPEKS